LRATRAWPSCSGIDCHDGYLAPFTRQQSPLAKYKNGSRVTKARQDESGDLHKPGAQGTVLGSIGAPVIGVAYFVEWDDMPKLPSLVVEAKLEARQP